MQNFDKDLTAWIPYLLAVWRRRQAKPAGGPMDGLSAQELALVAQGVKTLSKGFTGKRRLVGEKYLSDPALLGAYLLYYWPISYAQARYALQFATPGLKTGLDLGSGPAPLALAMKDWGIEKLNIVDHSRAALRLAQELAASRNIYLEAAPWNALETASLPQGSFDLISMGHTLNELWEGDENKLQRREILLQQLFDHLNPGGLVLILEPALMNTSRDLLALRDRLVAAGHPLLYPCIWKGECPALKQEAGTCHAELSWRVPNLVRQIAYAAGLQKEAVKMTVLLVGNKGQEEPQGQSGPLYRVVSEAMLSKSGRTRYLICGSEGRLSLSASRENAGPWAKDFFTLQRGDLLSFEQAERRENGYGLLRTSQLLVLEKSGPKKMAAFKKRPFFRKNRF